MNVYPANPDRSAVACLLANVAHTSVATGVQKIPWPTEISDAFAMHNPADDTKITIVVPGKYLFTFSIYADVVTNTQFILGGILRNNTNFYGVNVVPAPAAAAMGVGGSFILDCAAGEYFEIQIQTNGSAPSSGTFTLYNGTYFNTFSAARLGL